MEGPNENCRSNCVCSGSAAFHAMGQLSDVGDPSRLPAVRPNLGAPPPRTPDGKTDLPVGKQFIFRDGLVLDASGNFISDAAQVTERFHRLNYGNM